MAHNFTSFVVQIFSTDKIQFSQIFYCSFYDDTHGNFLLETLFIYIIHLLYYIYVMMKNKNIYTYNYLQYISTVKKTFRTGTR